MQAEIADATLRERLLLLRAMEALRALDESSLILLAEHARVRRFRAGDIVIAEGGPIDAVHLVTSGQITVTVSGKTIAVVGPGYGAGFAPLLARIPTGVRAVADVATQTLEIAAEVLLDVYEQDFAFIRNVMRLQSRSILGVRDGLPADPANPPAVDLGTWRDVERTLVERVLAIHAQPIFQGASLDAVIELVRSDVEVRYAAGDRIWAAGDSSSRRDSRVNSASVARRASASAGSRRSRNRSRLARLRRSFRPASSAASVGARPRPLRSNRPSSRRTARLDTCTPRWLAATSSRWCASSRTRRR